MDTKMLARIGAVTFVTLAITAGMIEYTRNDGAPELAAPRPWVEPQATSPLQTELRRCQALGEVGPRDAACLKAWAENRRRFLTTGTQSSEREPAAPTLPANLKERLGLAPIPPVPVAPLAPASGTPAVAFEAR